jgi:hypothetical protein
MGTTFMAVVDDDEKVRERIGAQWRHDLERNM